MSKVHRVLDRQEVQIHANMLRMAKLAEQALASAMDSLMSQNAELAEQVVEGDLQINTMLRVIENECLQAIALHQPVAADLRDIIASLQVATEIERIADHAKDIAKIVLGMDPGDFSGPIDRLGEMNDLCVNMFTRVIEAYGNRDADLALAAAAEDSTVDELDRQAKSSLMMQLMTGADSTMHATHLLWIAYHLERIGDRVTNIAERVVFMVTAETPELG
ncbi:MAG: phosphate signaling complex protein PhoU [Gammaproteobacteria bacterium]|nr:phosphate signaling complex protein PhoU [Gammaproteobacteria bacterium]